MDLISCPNCGRSTKKFQKNCWHCGVSVFTEDSHDLSNSNVGHNAGSTESVSTQQQMNFQIESTNEIIENSEIKPKTQKCPFCAEEIKFDAILCRFCHSNISLNQQFVPDKTLNNTNQKSILSSQNLTIGDGIKLGFGMFIVLPLILFVCLVLFIWVFGNENNYSLKNYFLIILFWVIFGVINEKNK